MDGRLLEGFPFSLVKGTYRSAEDANIFLVNDLQDPLQVLLMSFKILLALTTAQVLLHRFTLPPTLIWLLQRTLSSLELPGAVSVANSPTSSIAPSKSSFSRTDGEALDKNSAVIQQNGRQRQKHNDPRHLSIQVLEKFSLVTRFARETKSQFLREAQGDGFISNAMKKHDKKTNNYSSVVESNDVHKPLEDVHVPANSSEVRISHVLHSSFWISLIFLLKAPGVEDDGPDLSLYLCI